MPHGKLSSIASRVSRGFTALLDGLARPELSSSVWLFCGVSSFSPSKAVLSSKDSGGKK